MPAGNSGYATTLSQILAKTPTIVVFASGYNSVLRWQVEAQNQVVRKLEEKERLLQTIIPYYAGR